MNTLDPARNYKARPGYELHDMIALPGWDDQSIWGWDAATGSFFGQLWRNGSTADEPEIWLTGTRKPYPWPACIALEIVETTKAEPIAVVHAMGIADPDPSLIDEPEIRARVSELTRALDASPYGMSKVQALAWVLGTAPLSPGTRTAWQEKPTAAQVDAEHHMVTGRVYREVSERDYFSGADEALWWALGR
ncbi:hypothetical protein ACIRG5_45785 [Lentzea sp. NPDC102401]|uniref:hypothetical protein n=1 Tax=Lentzea sp. NPDC102401 TaxID=3364128 RepID=UPI00382DD6EB